MSKQETTVLPWYRRACLSLRYACVCGGGGGVEPRGWLASECVGATPLVKQNVYMSGKMLSVWLPVSCACDSRVCLFGKELLVRLRVRYSQKGLCRARQSSTPVLLCCLLSADICIAYRPIARVLVSILFCVLLRLSAALPAFVLLLLLAPWPASLFFSSETATWKCRNYLLYKKKKKCTRFSYIT